MSAKVVELEKYYLIEQLKAVATQTEHNGVKRVMEKAIEFIGRQ